MGYAALVGRPGIVSIEKSWQDLGEVDRVVYDPAVITLQDMVGALKESGTFRKIISDTGPAAERRKKGNETH